jgi:acetyl-CoA acetyltransferase
MRGEIVIAGIGATTFGKLGRGTLSLNVEASRKALADAGVDKSDVDAVFVKTPTSKREFMYGQQLAEALGITPRMGGAWDQGGAANISLITFAALAIQAGQCEVALVCYADNPRSGARDVYARPRGEDTAYGWFSTAAGYAMIHQRYLIEHKPPPEAFGEVAVVARANGAANPHAQLRKPISMTEYLAGPFVVEPMRRDDICLVSDGGAAIVMMSAKKAKHLGVKKPVPILGLGHGQTSAALINRPSLTSTMAKSAAHTAFTMAGLTPKDIDVAQIYDCFTITVLMTLEDYGFCKPGQAASFVAEGRIAKDGDLPINTSGGLLSETGMPGLQLVQEGVRQMRGESVVQIKNAATALISNQGGVMDTHATLILGGAA